jgi:hypothetical protein
MPIFFVEQIGISNLALPRAELFCLGHSLLAQPLNLHQSHVFCKVSWLRFT